MQTATLELTRHAHHRSAQRKPPAFVMQAVRNDGGTDFPCGHPAYRGVTLRVVRTSDAYWIAAHRAGDLITLYRKTDDELDAWAWTYLLHPEQNGHRLRRLTVTHSPEEAVTKELYAKWVLSA
jgi:hypothetical protein